MAPTNVGYSLKEAISHFFRNWTTSLGAVITIFLSLFIIGLFIMGSAMLNSVIGTVEDQVVINAFISDDADQADVQAFEAELKTWNNVKSVTYKDKDDALAEYTSKMSGNADATMSALDGQNPRRLLIAIEMDDRQGREHGPEAQETPISRRSRTTATSTRAFCTARRK
ncbi:MAG: cell division protein FtsX [Collinsella sp.]